MYCTLLWLNIFKSPGLIKLEKRCYTLQTPIVNYCLLCILLCFHGNILVLLWHFSKAVVLHLKAAIPQLSPVEANHHPRHKVTRGDVSAQRDSLNMILQYQLVVDTDVLDGGRGLGGELVLCVCGGGDRKKQSTSTVHKELGKTIEHCRYDLILCTSNDYVQIALWPKATVTMGQGVEPSLTA